MAKKKSGGVSPGLRPRASITDPTASMYGPGLNGLIEDSSTLRLFIKPVMNGGIFDEWWHVRNAPHPVPFPACIPPIALAQDAKDATWREVVFGMPEIPFQFVTNNIRRKNKKYRGGRGPADHRSIRVGFRIRL